MKKPNQVVIHASLDKVDLMREASEKLVSLGIDSILPDLHRYQHIRDEFGDHASFDRIKCKLARENCENMKLGDAIIILNPPHRGFSGYVGGASFSQMVVAFMLRKPIFITDEPDPKLPYCEEIRSFLPIVIPPIGSWAEEHFLFHENAASFS